jgi:hypothetical protein
LYLNTDTKILARLNFDINEYLSNYKRNNEQRKMEIVSTPFRSNNENSTFFDGGG